MDLFDAKKPEHPRLADLHSQLEILIQACTQLKDENRSLRQQQSQLISERAGLIEKNDLARNRVEGMINRLKAMEDPNTSSPASPQEDDE
jgi:cell division protein ZapB